MAYLNLKPVEFSALSAKTQSAFQWEGRILMPKWDGCFAMVLFWDGQPDMILSRDGSVVRSMQHVEQQVLLTHPWISDEAGGVAVLGEAWIPNTEFKDISGAFRRHANQPQLQLKEFDVVGYTPGADIADVGLYSHLPYHRRLARLGIAPYYIESEEHAKIYAQDLKNAGGYDGAIVADPAAPYIPGSGKCGSFIKVKPLQSFTLEVVGVEVGVGAKTGRATAALVVRFKGTACNVGTGFTPDEARRWARDPALVVGHLAEVECMAVYDGPDGLMREPRLKGWRDDVTQPDY